MLFETFIRIVLDTPIKKLSRKNLTNRVVKNVPMNKTSSCSFKFNKN